MKDCKSYLLPISIFFLLITGACKKSGVPAIPILPTIASISPSSGNSGTVVSITGTNFSTLASDNTVKFNGVAATVTSASATALIVTAPMGGSTGAVTVSNASGTATGPNFTYIALPLPAISSISPGSGTAGTLVTITGTNFKTTPTDNTVKFNGTAATVTSATATALQVTAPAGGSSGAITVTTSAGTATSPVFTYLTGPTIYTCGGQTDGSVGYWSNSTFTNVPNWTNPRAITGSGNDIYLAGSNKLNNPIYWKNGTAITLDSRTGFTVGIFVNGTDVYTTGIISGLPTAPYNLPKYWKNGTGYDLTDGPNGGAMPSSIFVSGSDVYVAGYREVTSPYFWNACYWKNGVPVDLTLGLSSNATATGIYVAGSDVYVVGVEEEKSGIGIINKAPRLWKNGVSIPLTTPANSLYNNTSSVALIGSDVYVGGQYNGKAAVWKNGTMVDVAAYEVAEQITAIFVYNNTDLYISGSSAVWGMNGYWKNGSFVEMDPGCTIAGTGCAHTYSNNVSGIYVK